MRSCQSIPFSVSVDFEALDASHRVDSRVCKRDPATSRVTLKAPTLDNSGFVSHCNLHVALQELPREESVVNTDDVRQSLATVSNTGLERPDLSSVSTGGDLRHHLSRLENLLIGDTIDDFEGYRTGRDRVRFLLDVL